jgi:hypothetical protein
MILIYPELFMIERVTKLDALKVWLLGAMINGHYAKLTVFSEPA